jgi:formylglycine-generating enzyme required for sulfatase activity/thioredoxin reductase
MSNKTDLLIIGAGPYGLAMAAYAKHHNIDYKIVGKSMEFWKSNTPEGMYLRSDCEWHFDSVEIHTIEGFLRTKNQTLDEVKLLSRELFIEYAEWFQEQKSIKVIPEYVTRLNLLDKNQGFEAVLETGNKLLATNVLIAIGFSCFKYIPSSLRERLPVNCFVHTCDFTDFKELRGKRCLIIGGRQSAFEWAALINEQGAQEVHVCYQHRTPSFTKPDFSWVKSDIEKFSKDPSWYRKLDQKAQQLIVKRFWEEGRTKLEEWLSSRIEVGSIRKHSQTKLEYCEELSSGEIKVLLDSDEELTVDKIILATGYSTNVNSIPFLRNGNLFAKIETKDDQPLLDENFQSVSVPGLFLTSMLATQDFGPFFKFIFGSRVSANIVGEYLKKSIFKSLEEKIKGLEVLLEDESFEESPDVELWIKSKLIDLKDRLQFFQSPSGTNISGDVSTGGGPFIGRDQILTSLENRSVIVASNAESGIIVTGNDNTVEVKSFAGSSKILLESYYRTLAKECSDLPLVVVHSKYKSLDKDSEISLSKIYTDLDVIAFSQDKGMDISQTGERLPILKSINQEHEKLFVLLGDPGSGKTTFINYLTFLLANNASGSENKKTSIIEFDENLSNLLPIRILLRSTAKYLPIGGQKGTANMLWQVIQSEMVESMGLPQSLFSYLQERILKEGAFLLLDGLDEVPGAEDRRQCLLEAIQSFVRSLPSRSRVVLTARPYAYRDSKWHLPGFKVLTLAPFNMEQISRFVKGWYQTVRGLSVDRDRRDESVTQLITALEERKNLSELASRPLLLTLMAILHSSGGQLPEDRSSLYEESVKLLLLRWQNQLKLKDSNGTLIIQHGLDKDLGISESKIRTAVEKLAFEAYEYQGSSSDRELLSDISRKDVVDCFSSFVPDHFNPTVLLTYLETRVGLLIGRGEDKYAFLHRSFQEYLTACHLANYAKDFSMTLRELLYKDIEWWREVFLLGIGKKKQGGLSEAVNVVNALLPLDIKEEDEISIIQWQVASLSGQALLELRVIQEGEKQELFETVVERVRKYLKVLVSAGKLSPQERHTAGDVLGLLGDNRTGVGSISIHINGKDCKIPDIDWVKIPAGFFVMGADEHESYARDIEKKSHMVNLDEYYISRYPITNAQFRLFDEADGFKNESYWSTDGWAWCQEKRGHEVDISWIDDDAYKQRYENWLSQRQIVRRNRPWWWDSSRWGGPTRPVVGVSWFEALAFCKWLEEQYQHADENAPIFLTSDLGIYMPSEAEWEKAARGESPIIWPWGNDWQDGLANTNEAGLQGTSAVGSFPESKSPYGVHDLAGNVWEWTTTRWSLNSVNWPDYTFPYNPNDGREDLTGAYWRVVKGGSWFYDLSYARCASRSRNTSASYAFHDLIGFRVVISKKRQKF